jgi:hypothetical protein
MKYFRTSGCVQFITEGDSMSWSAAADFCNAQVEQKFQNTPFKFNKLTPSANPSVEIKQNASIDLFVNK